MYSSISFEKAAPGDIGTVFFELDSTALIHVTIAISRACITRADSQ